ncbi:MAG: LamG-like jellyroll fold domain-containing protein [Bacteroidota bacterium]|nr:LamG-like jellyroll fold domain-containing protein [Bacteroidota bacterium]
MKTILLNLFLICITINVYAQTADSLVAFYPFNGNAVEELGSGIDGLINGASLTTDRFGHADSAYLFISDYPSFIDLGDSFDDIFAIAEAKFSFSFWILAYDNMANKAIFSKYGNSNCNEHGREFLIRISTDQKLEFMNFRYLHTTNTRQGVKGNTVIISNNGWRHIVISYDGSIPSSNGLERIKIYINGIQESTSYTTNQGNIEIMEDGPSHFGIGLPLDSLGQACGDFAFDGKIDDVKLFSKVLSLSEIDSLFNEPDPTIPSLSITERKIECISVFPNPVKKELNINNKNEVRLSLYGLSGNLIIEEQAFVPHGKLNLDGLENGIYILKIIEKNSLHVFKINKVE